MQHVAVHGFHYSQPLQGVVACLDLEAIPIEVISKPADGPNYGQALQFGCTIVLFGRVSGEAGAGSHVPFAILNLGQDSPQPLRQGIGIEVESEIKIGEGSHRLGL